MNETRISRRDFLELMRIFFLATSGVLGLGMLLRYLQTPPREPEPTEFDLGHISDYAPGSRTLLPEVPALLIRKDATLTVLSLACSHLGCTVKPDSDGFSCPCHGSSFDGLGRVVRGPAVHPLAHLRLVVAPDGRMTLYKDEE